MFNVVRFLLFLHIPPPFAPQANINSEPPQDGRGGGRRRGPPEIRHRRRLGVPRHPRRGPAARPAQTRPVPDDAASRRGRCHSDRGRDEPRPRGSAAAPAQGSAQPRGGEQVTPTRPAPGYTGDICLPAPGGSAAPGERLEQQLPLTAELSVSSDTWRPICAALCCAVSVLAHAFWGLDSDGSIKPPLSRVCGSGVVPHFPPVLCKCCCGAWFRVWLVCVLNRKTCTLHFSALNSSLWEKTDLMHSVNFVKSFVEKRHRDSEGCALLLWSVGCGVRCACCCCGLMKTKLCSSVSLFVPFAVTGTKNSNSSSLLRRLDIYS